MDSHAAVGRLVDALPTLADDWRANRDQQDFGDLPYVGAANLAFLLVARRQEVNATELIRLFQTVEELLGGPVAEVRELVAFGFLEDLSGAMGNAGLSLDYWRPYLQPKSRLTFDTIAGWYEGRIPIEELRQLRASIQGNPNRSTNRK